MGTVALNGASRDLNDPSERRASLHTDGATGLLSPPALSART